MSNLSELQIAQKQLKDLQSTINQLEQKAKEDTEEKEADYRFIPDTSSTFHFIQSSGRPEEDEEFAPSYKIDYNRCLVGNVFETDEDARRCAARTRVNQLLWAFAKQANNGWKFSDSPEVRGYYLYVDTEDTVTTLSIGNLYTVNSGEIFFKRKEDLQRAIKFIGEQTILDALQDK